MNSDEIMIRGSNLSDLPAVHELAQLDGGVEPQGDMLLAFVNDRRRSDGGLQSERRCWRDNRDAVGGLRDGRVRRARDKRAEVQACYSRR